MSPQTMAVQKSAPKDANVRKRRAHNKSRRGCRNCKLRKVKCDETRPACFKCSSFGVTCNYDSGSRADLQPSYDKEVSLTLVTPPTTPSSISTNTNHIAGPNIWIPTALSPIYFFGDDISSFQLDTESWGRLDRFQHRTVKTIGTKNAGNLFANLTMDLAFAHPYLMHVVQVLTVLHDRHLSPTPFSKQTLPEHYHLSRAAALFNRKLSSPIRNEDRDGLWATAALLGFISFSLTDASHPSETWPLAEPPPDQDPLEWISIAESKSAIFNLTNPLRPDSRFSVMKHDYENSSPAGKIPLHGNEGIPQPFIKLFEMNEWSTPKSNLYFMALHILIPLLPVPCERGNIVKFLAFISHMEEGFKGLMRERDPRALLLLAYWYAKVWKAVWWIERRAVLECEAICVFLEERCGGDKLLMDLLAFPKRRCGLEVEGTWLGKEDVLRVEEVGMEDPLQSVELFKANLEGSAEKERFEVVWPVCTNSVF